MTLERLRYYLERLAAIERGALDQYEFICTTEDWGYMTDRELVEERLSASASIGLQANGRMLLEALRRSQG